MPRQPHREDYTVGWVCALPVELAAARVMLDEEYETLDLEVNDTNIYTLGRISQHNVVIACLPAGQLGTNSAAAVAVQMKSAFTSIRFGLMVGIGGGVPSLEDIRLGDVVVSKPHNVHGGVVQYDFGKATPSEFERIGFLNSPQEILLNAISNIQADQLIGKSRLSEYLSKLGDITIFKRKNAGLDVLFQADYNHVGGDTCEKCNKQRLVVRKPRAEEVVVYYGTIASGNQVMRDAVKRDEISAKLGSVLCFEMEAAGLINSFPCLVVRGICDYADSHKNKKWQAYAAGAAAAYAKVVLSVIPAAVVAKSQTVNEIIGERNALEDILNRLPYAPEAPFNSYHRRCEPTCLPSTRLDLLREIFNWADGQDEPCIFWLNGLAGTGKSTIARTIAREWFEKGYLGASFFFSRDSGDVSHAGKFFTSIAVQLARNDLALQHCICKAIAECGDVTNQSLQDQWHQLILHPLLKLKSKPRWPFYILVIDALDECDNDNDVQIILQLLAETQSSKMVQLRVFLTSRPEIPIRHGFYQIPDAKRRDSILHSISPTIVNHDISIFLKHNLGLIREERALDADWPGNQAIIQLVQRASGLFIWAATACRFIREGKRFATKRLAMILNGCSAKTAITVPEKRLNEIYITVLKHSISPHYTSEEKEELYSMFRHMLGSIVTLLSPLSTYSLSRLLNIPREDIEQTLEDLHAIINIPKDRTHPLRLHHPSFRDFLLNKDRCGDSNLQVDEEQAHQIVAINCIRLMSTGCTALKQDICDLDIPGVLVTDVEKSRIEKSLSPEVQYACLYWVQHLYKSGSQICDSDDVHQFLQTHLLHWLEALSWMQKISDGIFAIISLESIALAGNCPQFTEFIQDIKRFVQYGRPIIEQAPLQIYLSALVFAPKRSKVRDKFLSQALRWIKILPNTRQGWSALLQTLEGHTDSVNALALSKDGKMLASASADYTIRLWDPTTGQCLQTLKGHTGSVKAIAFSPDGKILASVSNDYTVRLWDPITGQCLHTLKGYTASVNAITFSNDGKIPVSAFDDRAIWLWDPTTGQCLQTFQGYTYSVNVITFSPDGKVLALASGDFTVRLWDPITGQCVQTLKGHSGSVRVVTFLPDGKILASASHDRTVRLWDPTTGQCLQTLRGHTYCVNTIALSPDGKMLASASNDCTVRLWDPTTGKCLQTLRGHTYWVRAITFSSDGKMLASASADYTIRLWDPTTGQSLQTLEGHTGSIKAIAFLPDGKILASASADYTVRLWDPTIGQYLQTLKGHTGSVKAITFSYDGKILASASDDRTIWLWDPTTGQSLQILKGHTGSVKAIAFSLDGKILASASHDSTVRLWDLTVGQCLKTLKGHTGAVKAITFSPDGKVLVSASCDCIVRLWDSTIGQCLQTLEGHTGSVNAIIFSPDGKMLASASNDYTVRLWDPATGQSLQTLRGHTYWVNTIALSPDGKMLASASNDCTVRLWDSATGQCLQILDSHCHWANTIAFSPDGKTLAFSPDGKMLASASYDHIVRLWDPTTGQCLQTLEGQTSLVNAIAFSKNGQYLNTNRGILILNSAALGACRSPEPPVSAIFVNDTWVTQNAQNLLWLPPEYRGPTCLSVNNNTVTFGYESGQVIVLEFATPS